MKSVIKPVVKNIQGFIPVGHRGADGELPGNTIESFRHLTRLFPETIIELDVWCTKDGRIVVYHDEYLEHETDGTGRIIEYFYTELLRLDRGYRFSHDNGMTFPFRKKDYRIPLFSDVLKEFPYSIISVDIKYHNIEFAENLFSMIREHNSIDRVIIGSFNYRILKYMRRNHSEIATSYSIMDVIKFILSRKIKFFRNLLQGDILMVPEIISFKGAVLEDDYGSGGLRIVNPEMISHAKQLGMPVIVWTINSSENMKRLIEWGVDGIVTDYPSLLKDVMTGLEII